MTCRDPACHQDGLEQSPANPLLTHLHHLSSTKLSILLQGSQAPGQHHTNLRQPASPGISNPGWYLLHHQADLAPPKQRGCLYSPTCPKGALHLPAQLHSSKHTFRHCTPQGLHESFWAGAQSPQRQGRQLGQHGLASAPSKPQLSSCSTKRDHS